MAQSHPSSSSDSRTPNVPTAIRLCYTRAQHHHHHGAVGDHASTTLSFTIKHAHRHALRHHPCKEPTIGLCSDFLCCSPLFWCSVPQATSLTKTTTPVQAHWALPSTPRGYKPHSCHSDSPALIRYQASLQHRQTYTCIPPNLSAHTHANTTNSPVILPHRIQASSISSDGLPSKTQLS
jgi:hypothetical protein